ncbi:MAG: 4-(cytidine 5'-diphospho)-2-C-methyl-D-erythritol kinase [Aliishimia sp.]
MEGSVLAPAKINLTLHVTGQRADGYHLLDSLVVFASLGDHIRVKDADAISIEVSGPFADGVPCDARNLVWRAAEMAGVTPHIQLEKNLPHGAGLGGGSSDAAAILRTFGGQERAAELGADVPVCLNLIPQRMQGIGDVLAPVPVCALDLVLVNPRVHVPTPDVFHALTTKTNSGMGELPDLTSYSSALAWLSQQRNDLETAALSVAAQIGDALDALKGADLMRMSGSGATCFGVYPTAAQAESAATAIGAAHPDWWVQATQTLSSL